MHHPPLHDGRDAADVSDIRERVAVEHDEIRSMARDDPSHVVLSDEGLLTNGSRGRIGLGPLLIALAHSSERALGEELHSVMRQLSAQLEETVDLSVPDGDAVRFVAQQPGTRPLHALSAVGARFPMHCTSGGKALLAVMPRSEAMDLVPVRIPALTPNTITSRRALWQELDDIRETRVAFDREEHTLGIAAVGVVVRDAFGSLATMVAAGRLAPCLSRSQDPPRSAPSVNRPADHMAARRSRPHRRLQPRAGVRSRVRPQELRRGPVALAGSAG